MNLTKTFNKKRVVKAVIYGADKRIKVFYVLPKNDSLTIKNVSYVINEKDFYLDNENIPTYLYRHDSTEPINPHDSKKSVLTPDYYNTAINAHVARDVFEATKGGMDFATISLVVSVITLVVVGGGLYMLFKNLGDTNLKVNSIYDLIKVIGGMTE